MTIRNFDALPDTAHITVKDVAALFSVSVATIWNWVKSEQLPEPKRFGTRCTRWEYGVIRKAAGIERKSQLESGFTIIELLIIIAIIGIVAAVAIPAWSNRNEPTEILKTKDWQCIKSEEREYTYPMLVGKITVMKKGRRSECVQWQRRDG